ncbi:MAG: NERD domain-containing protein [Candidatus Halichondribacter symbioticus]
MPPKRKISPPIEDHEDLRQKMTPGEELVFHLFNNHLPPDWEIYIQPHLNGLRPDFVLLSPQRGIAVFEVKDWDLNAMEYFTKEYESQYDKKKYHKLWAKKDGKEFSKQSDNPIPKVNLYKKEIFDIYCPRIQAERGQKAFSVITAGVIFPFAKNIQVKELFLPFTKKISCDYQKYHPISGKEDIESKNINDIFPEFSRKPSYFMTPELTKDLRGWLDETDFTKIQRKPFILDSHQKLLANTNRKSGYRRIKGPAGSGKSLVLAARAARLASEGKSVLVITYNITLWHYLYDLTARALQGINAPVKKSRDNICFINFHLWCKHVCYNAGLDNDYNELYKHLNLLDTDELQDKFFNTEIIPLVKKSIMHPDFSRYDAILVDEGQDYHLPWWNVLQDTCKPNGEMVLAVDKTQDIYGTAKAWTDEAMTGAGFLGRWAELKISYRLPPKIITLVQGFAKEFIPSADLPQSNQAPLDFYPCSLRWVQCESRNSKQTCVEEIKFMMRQTGKNGLANADIAIIAQTLDSGKAIVEHLAKDKIKAIHTFDDDIKIRRSQKMAFYMGDARLKATTLHSFKGWECPILILHITDAHDDKNLALIYAGLTRLKRRTEGSWLTVVCSASRLSEYGKTWPNYEEI